MHVRRVPLIPEFRRLYPQIDLELDCSDRLVEMVEEGFDAVIRSGARAAATQGFKDRLQARFSNAHRDRTGASCAPCWIRTCATRGTFQFCGLPTGNSRQSCACSWTFWRSGCSGYDLFSWNTRA